MTEQGPLAADYPQARSRFLDAIRRHGASLESRALPDRGPSGEELALDVAWFGPEPASQVILVVSGTHGVEGYAGSMCQSRWLESQPSLDLPDGMALVFLHAFNPYGFAWVRRVNEDNVDINRNFADLSAPPANPGYDELAEVLAPAAWDEATRAATDTAILEWAGKHGFDALQAAVSGGQYDHPDGLFYGGQAPVRSHRIMRELITGRIVGADRVVMLDLHTGLGEWSEVELITDEPPESDAFGRARAWWGDRVASNAVEGESVSATLTGEWMGAATSWLAPAEVTAVALEWGTVDSLTVAQALRADNWLHNHGDPQGADAPAIKAELRRAFAPDDHAWAEAVYRCFEDVLGIALTKIAASA